MTEAVLTPASPKISSADRLCFTLFLAVALHVTMIIGVGFDIYNGSTPSPSIEVTLSRVPSDKPPQEADFMAQDNQLGGGVLTEAAMPSVTQLSEHVTQQSSNTTPEAPPPSQRQRLRRGVGFDIYTGSTPSPSIEVTLSRVPSDKPPQEADFMAQDNQLGGGVLTEAAMPSVTQLSEHVTQQSSNTTPEAPPPSQRQQKQQQTAVVTTQAKMQQSALTLSQSASQLKLEQLSEKISRQEQSMGLVSRDAKLDLFEQLLTKERVLKVNSVATLQARDAFYVKQWIDKIERVGRLNYPTEALRKNIEGELSLTVILLPDGTIRELKVVRSSGHQVLDDAAINIVRRAGHFPPFSADMKKHW